MAREEMKDVISCSRRFDVPAFRYAWLQDVLALGRADLRNPYSGAPYSVDLSIGKIHSIVLWSKDFGNVLNDPGMLDAYNLYFQFTITGYGRPLEPYVQPAAEALRQMESLVARYSPKQVMWRYDPLVFLEAGDPVAERLETFRRLSYEVSSLGVTECTISFMTPYPEVEARLARCGARTFDFDDGLKADIGREIADIAGENGMILRSCSDPLLARVPYVEPARCIDADRLERLFGGRVSRAKDPGQRPACSCSKSRDIGSYGQGACPHGCLYCYATRSHEMAGRP